MTVRRCVGKWGTWLGPGPTRRLSNQFGEDEGAARDVWWSSTGPALHAITEQGAKDPLNG
ncbi:hypothetical protein GCM10022207_85820 [Streptomyces lannensis]|jgi:hypothetical protein|uniref:Uncharacterized protein n=1 Tax=Streptomyces lannensis TaxID=766498 RepID=A0ABP7LLR0_9ACTN